MKPFKIVLFILVVYFFLALVIIIFPNKKLTLFGDFSLEFVTFEDLFDLNHVQYTDIKNIIEKNTEQENFLDSVPWVDLSLIGKNEKKTEPIQPVSEVENGVQKIEFSNENPKILYPIFEELSCLRDQPKKIRILHYGDSQIEGDRITSYIRKKLQKKFGGSGPGLIQPYTGMNFTGCWYCDYSSHWKRHVLYGRRDTTIHHSLYGPMMSYAEFDTNQISEDTTQSGIWLQFHKNNLAYSNTRYFKQCQVLLNQLQDSLKINFYHHDTMLKTKTILPQNSLQIVNWLPKHRQAEFKIEFVGNASPNILAIGLGDTTGVYVDNIPMRGSSGIEFIRINRQHLKKIYDTLNVKMLIMSFGVNVVPNVVKDYSFYRYSFYKQLKYFKSIFPNLPVIVLGISDVSIKKGNYYQTSPNIESIRDAQRKAAFMANCAFWDTYSAMGGKNSMPSWVFADPPLAQKDFMHFNHRGAKLIGEMFYKAFMKEYQNYLKTKDHSLHEEN